MSGERLSALDAGFLAVERPGTPMHVGWVATFDAPEDGGRPEFAALRAHIAGRMAGAPRFRQRLAGVPLGLHDPVWVDDPAFDAASHLRHAPGPDLDAVVDAILSTPLSRDRPLWEMWIADELADGRVGLIGKAHHCMVDGAAVVELGNVLLDREPETARARRATTGRPRPCRRRASGSAAPRSTGPPTRRRWRSPPSASPVRPAACGGCRTGSGAAPAS